MTRLLSDGAFGRAFPDSLAVFIDFDESSAGPTPPEVSRSVRSLLGLVRPGEDLQTIDPRRDDFYTVAQNYLKKFDRADPSGGWSHIFMAYFSTFFHEARHIHDLLSTVFGQSLLGSNYNYYQNSILLVGLLKQWHRETRQPVRIPLRRHAGAINGANGQLAKLVRGFVDLQTRQERAGAPDGGIYSWMTGSHLLEASATLIQVDMLHDIFGNEGASRFWRSLNDSSAAQTYTGLINAISEVFVMRRNVSAWQEGSGGAILGYLVWAALQSNECRYGGEIVCPSVIAYYHATAEHISRMAPSNADLDWVQSSVDAFNAQWGFPKIAETMAAYEADMPRLHAKFVEAWKDAPTDARDKLPAVYAACATSFRTLMTTILGRPEVYFTGRLYGWSVLTGVLPSIRVDFKVEGEHCICYTAGPPTIPRDIYDEMISYSTMFRLLVDGRDETGLKDVENECYEVLTKDYQLPIADGLFD